MVCYSIDIVQCRRYELELRRGIFLIKYPTNVKIDFLTIFKTIFTILYDLSYFNKVKLKFNHYIAIYKNMFC